MGAIKSKEFETTQEYHMYNPIITSLEKDSVSRVCSRIKSEKFKTSKQMERLTIIIYEKAITRHNITIKCAQLAKDLEDESIMEDGKKLHFHSVFAGYFIPLVDFIVSNYDDKFLSDFNIKRGMGLASFIGHLYNVRFFDIETIVKIANDEMKYRTPKSEIFFKHLAKTIKIKVNNIDLEPSFFKMMVEMYKKDRKYDPETSLPDGVLFTDFSSFITNIMNDRKVEIYENYDEFETESDIMHKKEIRFLYKGMLRKDEMLNLFRNIAIDVHHHHPNRICENLREELYNTIEKFETLRQVGSAKKIQKFEHIGKVVVEFYTARLIDGEIVDKYLTTGMLPKLPEKGFVMTFLEVLKMLESPLLHDFFKHLKRIVKNTPENRVILDVVKEHVRSKKSGDRSKSEICHLTNVARQQDLKSYSIKNYNKTSKSFQCENILSCHFASLTSIDILMGHIGSPFFTRSRIKVCAQKTKMWLKFPFIDKISEKFDREIRVYLSYFQNDINPVPKLRNFTYLMSDFYDESIIEHKPMVTLLDELHIIVKGKAHKFYSTYFDIFRETYYGVSNILLRDDPTAWMRHSILLDICAVQNSNFEDNQKFKELINEAKNKSKNLSIEELQMLKIPNEKATIREICKFLVDFYINHKSSGAFVATIYSLLTDKYEPKLDSNLLHSEFQDMLCNKLGYICSTNTLIESKQQKDAKSVIEFVEYLCINNQYTRQGLANIFKIMTDMIFKNPNSVLDLVKFSCLKLSQYFIKADPLSSNVVENIKDFRRKLEIAFGRDGNSADINKYKKILKIFGNILDDSKRKMKAGKNFESSEEIDEDVENNEEACGQNPLSKSSIPSTVNSEAPIELPPPAKEATNIRKICITDFKNYTDFSNYYESIEDMNSEDDKQLFDPYLFSWIKITKLKHITDFCSKIIQRVLANDSPIKFFAQNAVSYGSIFKKIKNQNISFNKVLIDEILKTFQNEKQLVEFVGELYNRDFLGKARMFEFVDKFKTEEQQNLILLYTFVKICETKLTAHGDVERLLEIRGIARSLKSSPELDKNLVFIAQDLATSVSFIISMIEDGRDKERKVDFSDVEDERIAEEVIKKSFENPKNALLAVKKLTAESMNILRMKCKNLLDKFPELPVSSDEFFNFVRFLAECEDFITSDPELIITFIEIFLQNSNNEVSCQSLKILLTNCGTKLEAFDKPKFDSYFQFFNAVLAENEDSKRSEYFKKFIKLRENSWTSLVVPENFYQDFVMMYSETSVNINELVKFLNSDDDEINKFIQVLWKILLKTPPHPSHADLCLHLSKQINNFIPSLTSFLSARWKTFHSLSDDIYSNDVKERLGKVVTFNAEIYIRGLYNDDNELLMWIEEKMLEKIPMEFVAKIGGILGASNYRKIQNKQLIEAIDEILKISGKAKEICAINSAEDLNEFE